MTFSIGIVGAGLFSSRFAELFKLHPRIGDVYVTDLLPQRAQEMVERNGLAGTVDSFEAMLDSDVDAVGIFTQRWTHGELVVRALKAGKHVYSAVPMAIAEDEIGEIIRLVESTGLTYMMGETHFYQPATVMCRGRRAEGDFGTVFYSEGDYVHDMDHGFYDAYKHSGGEGWKKTASVPPMLYSTHSVGGVLSVLGTHALAVSCVGFHDNRGDGVFDKSVSMFENDFSNASALFSLADGGSMRINEMRRVGYPGGFRESRYRFFGTDASFEQFATTALWQNREGIEDVTASLVTQNTISKDDESLSDVADELRDDFISGLAQVHDASVLPREFLGAPNGHGGSHHFLVNDFATAVDTRTLPTVNAWVAARFTLPGITAHKSALLNGTQLAVPDYRDAPVAVGEPFSVAIL
ncbi:MAG: Gfo/Idh/MocA family protein [Rhodoglobus sp.]